MRVKNAIPAVGSFAGEQEFSAFAIKGRAPLDEALDDGRPFFNQSTDGCDVTETITGHDGVVLVELDFIVIAESGGNSALRVFGRGLVQAVFRDYQNATGGGQFDGGT